MARRRIVGYGTADIQRPSSSNGFPLPPPPDGKPPVRLPLGGGAGAPPLPSPPGGAGLNGAPPQQGSGAVDEQELMRLLQSLSARADQV